MPTSVGEDSDSERSKKKKCEICGDNIRSSGVKCSGCHCSMHSKCFEQVARIFKADRLNWQCKNCSCKLPHSSKKVADVQDLLKENESLKREIELLKIIVSEQNYSNKLLNERIEELKTNSVSTFQPLNINSRPTISYSETVKKLIKKDKQDSAVLLVKSENGNNIEIAEDVKSNIKPSELNNVVISNTKLIKDGLLINCENKSSLSQLKTKLISNLGNKYTIKEPAKLNPRIIIYGVDKDFELNNDFVEDMVKRNNISCGLEDFKIVTKMEKRHSANIVLQVSPFVRKAIMYQQTPSVYIGWCKCAVADYVVVSRCFTCCRYSHLKSKCTNSVTCPLCAGPHEIKDCKSENVECINCIEYNKLRKTNLPTNHSVKDHCCSVYKMKVEALISKINYDK